MNGDAMQFGIKPGKETINASFRRKSGICVLQILKRYFIKKGDGNEEEIFFFIYHIYPPFTRKQIVLLCFGRYVRTRLGVAISEVSGPPVSHTKVGRPVKCLAQGYNKRTCRLVLHDLP